VNKAVVAEIQASPDLVHQSSREIPDFIHLPNAPVIDIDLPWHSIVIHNLSAVSLRDSFNTGETYNNIWTILERKGGVASKDI